MVEILDAVVKFKRENLHACFEIHREIFLERDELRLAFFVDGAIVAVVEPLEVNTYAYAEPVLDKAVLPMDAALVIKRRSIDKFGACDFLPTF